MKIIKNEKLIKRNARIGTIANLLGMGIMIVGFILGWRGEPNQQVIVWLWVALLLGFALAQIGIYFTNRWGRRPRLDERLDQSLKGLSGDFTLYHFTTPVSHLLVGPAGVWVLMAYYQTGTITYTKNRWRQKSAGILHAYMRIFGQEGFGRPELEAQGAINTLERHLLKKDSEFEWPEIKVALVFTADNVTLEAGDAPMPALTGKKLKEFIRKQAKETPLSKNEIDKINATFEK